MKKFIDRMDAAQRPASPSSQETQDQTASGGKKKWGLGGMVKRVTGNVPTVSSLKKAEEEGGKAPEEQTGLQVDFYLVIVSDLRLSGGNALTCGNRSSSNSSPVLCRPSR